MKKIIIILAVFTALSINTSAQSGISLSQYTTTTSVINPAYSGASGRFTAQLVSRNQWVGIEGAPKTNTLIINTPVNNFNLGIGGSIIHEKIGAVN